MTRPPPPLLPVLCMALLCAAPAVAGVKYIPDPVYHSLDPEDEGPMDDMIALARGGDVRAQYIMGDLYAKGKGGLARDDKKAAHWFETSAKNGYHEAFIRLAAMAKRRKMPVAAYKWYTLAIESMRHGEWRKHAIKARAALQKDMKMTPQDVERARKEAGRWKERRAAEQKALRERERLEENRKKAGKPAAEPGKEKAADD